jgi:hypothetical protein
VFQYPFAFLGCVQQGRGVDGPFIPGIYMICKRKSSLGHIVSDSSGLFPASQQQKQAELAVHQQVGVSLGSSCL